jgi:hypothetical protein
MNAKANVSLSAALAVILIASSAPSLAGDEQVPHRDCSIQMLRGLYLFKGSGFIQPNGTLVPKAIVESIRFNGDGTLVAETVTLTIAGQAPVRHTGTPGTYTVDAGCTGTVTFADGPAFDTFVASPLLVAMIQTAGPNPAVPNVLQGDARFISR